MLRARGIASLRLRRMRAQHLPTPPRVCLVYPAPAAADRSPRPSSKTTCPALPDARARRHAHHRSGPGGRAGAVRRVHAARQHLHLRAPRHLRGSCEFDLSGNSTPAQPPGARRAAWYVVGPCYVAQAAVHYVAWWDVRRSAAKSGGRPRRRAHAHESVRPPARLRDAGTGGRGADQTSARMRTQTHASPAPGRMRSEPPISAGGS